MREMLFAALAAAALVAGAMPSDRAQAMTVAPSAPGATLIDRVVNVCGSNGCVKVQTQRVVKRHPPPPHH